MLQAWYEVEYFTAYVIANVAHRTLDKAINLNRRDFLTEAIGAGVTSVFANDAIAPVEATGDARLTAWENRLSYEGLLASPQGATRMGFDVGAHSYLRHRLNDRSYSASSTNFSRQKAANAAIESIDPTTLSAPMALQREISLYSRRIKTANFERFGIDNAQSPFIITGRDGAYCEIPDFLDNIHKISRPEDVEAYLDRVRAFAIAIDQDSDRQTFDAKRGYLPPAFVLQTALAQMTAFCTKSPAENLLTRSVSRRTKNMGSRDWLARCASIVEKEVYPALDRQIALLRKLCIDARTSAGIWDVPQGEALYAAALEDATTTKLSAAELHDVGTVQVADIQREIDKLLTSQGISGGEVGDRLLWLAARPEMSYADTEAGRAEIIADAKKIIGAMRDRLPTAFNNPPNLPLQIEPAALEFEDGVSTANYFRGSRDGSVPARVRLNLGALVGTPKFALPALIYHEALPGHHLQTSYGGFVSRWRFTAYSEGWAVYAEQLADELGCYGGPLQHIGYLQSRLYRAARLVVDTGIHAKRWTREHAVLYFSKASGLSPMLAQREVDRYCIQPGQACSYMVGYMAWTNARESVRQRSGERYSVKDFHDILRKGPVPLPILERFANQQTGYAR